MNYCEILKDADTIAVVGISSNPTKTSRKIANYLVSAGFNVVGVNPNCQQSDLDEIKVFRNLTDIPHKIDIVNIFRKSDDVIDLLPDILSIQPKVVWLQLGIFNNEVIESVKKEGIKGIQNRCIYVEHSKCSDNN
jgi:predicted CoA-binding protein